MDKKIIEWAKEGRKGYILGDIYTPTPTRGAAIASNDCLLYAVFPLVWILQFPTGFSIQNSKEFDESANFSAEFGMDITSTNFICTNFLTAT